MLSPDLPKLPLGKSYFAVIDVEAIVLKTPHIVNVVEQVAIVLIDQWGREVLGEKHMIYQPMDCSAISQMYGVPLAEVYKSVDAYQRITGDNYVHRDTKKYVPWADARKRVLGLCREYALLVYAKGILLESSVFYGEIEFMDLAWYGCPKYPLALHDPLQECRFFAQYIPESNPKPYYIF